MITLVNMGGYMQAAFALLMIDLSFALLMVVWFVSLLGVN